MKIPRTMLLAAGLLSLTACGPDEEPAAEATPERVEQAEMPGMGTMASGPMMEQMRDHLAAMRGAGADSLAALMPTHRQRVASLIAQMNGEMRDMDMGGDPAWNATVDSLRNDLRTMPEMAPAELRATMDAHHARIGRLMEMHRSMMERMPM